MPFYAEKCASMLAVTFSSGTSQHRSIVSLLPKIIFMMYLTWINNYKTSILSWYAKHIKVDFVNINSLHQISLCLQYSAELFSHTCSVYNPQCESIEKKVKT